MYGKHFGAFARHDGQKNESMFDFGRLLYMKCMLFHNVYFWRLKEKTFFLKVLRAIVQVQAKKRTL